MIPVAALVGLWAFAVVSMTADVRALTRVQDVYERYGTPVDAAMDQIRTERRMSAAYQIGRAHV